MDFRQNSTTTLFLFMNKTGVTHLMKENQNLHVLIFIQYNRKNEFWVKILFYTKNKFSSNFCQIHALCVFENK